MWPISCWREPPHYVAATRRERCSLHRRSRGWITAFLDVDSLFSGQYAERRVAAAIRTSAGGFPVFLFSLALAVITGILAGFFPALQISRFDLVNDLKDASRMSTPATRQNWFRDVLVATEVALSVVLLVAAGLLMHSFEQLVSKDLGLRTSNTLVMRFSMPDSKYHERAQVSSFLKTLQDRLLSAPGMNDVGLSSCPIVSVPGFCPDTVFQIEGHPSPSGHLMDAEYQQISPDFFRAAGVPLLAGKTLVTRWNAPMPLRSRSSIFRSSMEIPQTSASFCIQRLQTPVFPRPARSFINSIPISRCSVFRP